MCLVVLLMSYFLIPSAKILAGITSCQLVASKCFTALRSLHSGLPELWRAFRLVRCAFECFGGSWSLLFAESSGCQNVGEHFVLSVWCFWMLRELLELAFWSAGILLSIASCELVVFKCFGNCSLHFGVLKFGQAVRLVRDGGLLVLPKLVELPFQGA